MSTTADEKAGALQELAAKARQIKQPMLAAVLEVMAKAPLGSIAECARIELELKGLVEYAEPETHGILMLAARAMQG